MNPLQRINAAAKRKIIMRINLTTLILITAVLHVSASTFAQKVTLFERNASLNKVFEKISDQTGYDFLVSTENLRNAKSVTINVQNVELKLALDQIFAKQPLSFVIQEKMVVVSKKDPAAINKVKEAINVPVTINGKVTDTTGLPLQGATVKIKGTIKTASTDSEGLFSIVAQEGDEIEVSFIGYESYSFKVKSDELSQRIVLHEKSSRLNEVSVVSTGYQTIPKERATGSFTVIDNKTLNRAVSSDLLTRLNGVTNGLLINNNTGNPDGISIRGRSTLFSNTEPLIVIDNFPYEGDINSINPNDIETVTLLKDAAAASIWGVRAGNGVIVITTKKGKANAKPVVSFNTSLTIGEKPNLKYVPQLTSSEYIDVEKYLFNQGAYYQLGDDYEVISPVVAILNRQQLGQITTAQANQQISALKNIDDRNQESQYFYRRSSSQQYHFDISGGGQNETYYFSGGYDYNLPNAVATSNSRVTLKGDNTYRFLNDRLTLTTDINFTRSQTANNNAEGYRPLYPYEQVADANGNALAVQGIGGSGYTLRSAYTDTAGNGKLVNWQYRPLDELRNKTSTNTTDANDYRILLGLNYKIWKSLSASINYQYENINTKGRIDYNAQSFYVRDLVNAYSQIDPVSGVLTTPIPAGDVYTPSFTNYEANYGRGQLNFNQVFAGKNEINAIAGFEVRDEQTQFTSTTLYGYNPAIETSALIDNTTQFPSYFGPGASTFQLGNPNYLSSLTNRYISYYGNASYNYDQKYILSGSYRKDESNLFGVKANQKGVPLWSTGIAWNLDKEDFFKVNWLSTLKIRATYGYNGNVDQNLSAFLTARPSGLNPEYPNVNYSTITNPPNDALQWERVKNINLGLDFSSKDNRISGSVEYYIKNGIDLIGTSPIAPQEGVSTFTGNTADTHANGIDIQINSINVNGAFKWMTTGIFNHITDKVTAYKAPRGTNLNLLGGNSGLTPLEGYPINSIFGFKWMGLDNTGSPQGVLNGVKSEDYTSIGNSTNTSDLDFFGSAVPTTFGSLRNTFFYRSFEFSINISYKLNYYFRRASLNNTQLYNGNFQQPDYDLRWKKPGDELTTNVPALIYYPDANRDAVYQYSSILVDRADQIRLQDIQINYTFSKARFKSLPFSNLNIYLYANNLGILWRANKQVLDPDVYSGSYPNPKTIALGLKANF